MIEDIDLTITSVPVEAKVRQLHSKWSSIVSNEHYILSLEKDREFVMKWLSLHTDYHLVMHMLNEGGMKAIEFIEFDRLEELAEAFPSLAKRLADPTNGGRNA